MGLDLTPKIEKAVTRLGAWGALRGTLPLAATVIVSVALVESLAPPLTRLFSPSGAIYPINAFPGWLKAIAIVDPFSYAVHGFKALLLKEAGITAIWHDMLFLSLFAVGTMALATALFKRTL